MNTVALSHSRPSPHKHRQQVTRSLMILAAVVTLGPEFSFAWSPKQAPIMTPWSDLVDSDRPWPEYPRPQMVRSAWLNLNGVWQFQAGSADDPVPVNQTLANEILVPFPMESALSGVMEHHPRAWYRRLFAVPAEWSGQRILLHMEAVDWESEVFINGTSAGVHKGGYDPATYDLTPLLNGAGPQELIVRVYDPTDNAGEPRGKQTLSPQGIMYTSTSGIWQTVWLEPVPPTSIASLRLVPDIDAERLAITVNLRGPDPGLTVQAVARTGADVIGTVSGSPGAELLLPVPDPHLWSPAQPFLYDLDVTLLNGGAPVDTVTSYFGMRKISLGQRDGFVKMLLNNEFVFQFGPLDQGFWPDGIYTAPTDDALKSDLEQEKILGYNMVRKHIKVEPARWYYWADKLGILVWQDMPSANSYTGNPQPLDKPQFRAELTRLVEEHWNHPSVIMWVIFNEGQGQHDTASLVQMVKTMDPSRLVNQASGGNLEGVGDILDVHSYPNPSCPSSSTQAVVCGEFGGVGLSIANHIWAPGWGYIGAADGADLAAKFEDFCFQLSGFVQNQGLSAAVYTEITDVEIEHNGFLTYDREVRKPDADRIRTAVASVTTPITLTTVVPTSQIIAQTWRYRTSSPSSNWIAPDYVDTGWSEGPGGFGGNNPPNTAGLIRTPWTSSDIWLRRTFEVGALTADQINNLHFNIYHDEDVELYINGVLAASATGYTTNYSLLALTPAGRAAIVPNATNLLALHCHQTSGGQYIDAGLTIRESSIVVPPLPAPATPSGIHANVRGLSVSLGWSASTYATYYRLRRALISGGPYIDLLTVPINVATDPTLEPGTTYYYVVSALNESGESSPSAEVSITTAAVPPPEPVVWFQADGLMGLSNGAPVALWPDVTGHGYHATQDSASHRPTYAPQAIHGMPALRFDTAEDRYLSFPRPVQDDFTIFLVFQSNQGVGSGTDFYDGAGLVNGEVANVVNDFGLSLNANGRILAGTGYPDTTVVSGTSGFNDGQPHLVTFRRTRNTGRLELFVDGETQGSATGGTQSLTTPSRLVLGAQQTLIHHLTGEIAEVKIYDAALSEGERVTQELALGCKYALGIGTPPFDYDGDCDIDLADALALGACISGPFIPAEGPCLAKDTDGDGDVDQTDFAAFQRCYTGANRWPDPECRD